MNQTNGSRAAVVESPGFMANLVLGREGNPEVSPLRVPSGCSLHNVHDGARTLFTGPPFSINMACLGFPFAAVNPLRRRSVLPGTAPGAEHAGPMVLCNMAEA